MHTIHRDQSGVDPISFDAVPASLYVLLDSVQICVTSVHCANIYRLSCVGNSELKARRTDCMCGDAATPRGLSQMGPVGLDSQKPHVPVANNR